MRKCLSALSIIFSLLAICGTASCAVEDWRLFPKKYDGVSIAIRTHYFPYDCNVNWKFTNSNSYPVEIKIFNKTYHTNYGNKLVKDSYQTSAKLKPGESVSMSGLGDQLGYDWKEFGAVLNSRGQDKNGNKKTSFEVLGLKGFEYTVTKIDEPEPKQQANAAPENGAVPQSPGTLAKRRSTDGKEQWLLKCHDHGEEEWVDRDDIYICEVQGESNCTLAGTDKIHVKGKGLEGGHTWALDRIAYDSELEESKPMPPAESKWTVLPKQYNGVSLAIKFIYTQYGCEIQWKLTNHNAYSVKAQISNCVYATSYGKYTMPAYQTIELKKGETRATAGLMIPYNHKAFGSTLKTRNTDRSGSAVKVFEVTGLDSWSVSVNATGKAPAKKNTGGAKKLPSDAKTTR
ncbi:MAG: hypothetical protein LBQ19_02975 [Synergistaceae bacterium]|jgi:hypothetical protein|nr:hypothetical protein [Synergistaceae bacterium]